MIVNALISGNLILPSTINIRTEILDSKNRLTDSKSKIAASPLNI